MNLCSMLQTRGAPVRVGLIGAGEFGSMFLNQVPFVAGLEVAAIADAKPSRAEAALVSTGWSAEDRQHVVLPKPVRAGEVVRWSDVEIDETGMAVETRRSLEREFAGG